MCRLFPDEAGRDGGDQTPVRPPYLPHSDPVDDWIRQEVQHRKEIDYVEFDAKHFVRNAVEVNVSGQEVKDHVRQPEDNEGPGQQQGSHERFVVILRRVPSARPDALCAR